MSHLRAVLCEVGKQGPARNPAYRTKNLTPEGLGLDAVGA
jgi:hypothetical protein